MNFSILQIKPILVASLMLCGAPLAIAQTQGKSTFVIHYKHSKKRVVKADQKIIDQYLSGAADRITQIKKEYYAKKRASKLGKNPQLLLEAKAQADQRLDAEIATLQQKLNINKDNAAQMATAAPLNVDYLRQMQRWVNGTKEGKITYKHFADLVNQTMSLEGHERDGVAYGHERDGARPAEIENQRPLGFDPVDRLPHEVTHDDYHDDERQP